MTGLVIIVTSSSAVLAVLLIVANVLLLWERYRVRRTARELLSVLDRITAAASHREQR